MQFVIISLKSTENRLLNIRTIDFVTTWRSFITVTSNEAIEARVPFIMKDAV
jgi:hypothetical protein